MGLAESQIAEGWCSISYVAEMVEIISSIIPGGLLFNVSKADNWQRRIVRRIIEGHTTPASNEEERREALSSNQFESCCREMCLVKVRLEVGVDESVVRGLN